MNTVRLKDVKVKYKENRTNFLLEIDEFVAEKGIVTGIVGKNAKGKTTLLKAILNIASIKEGSVSIFGKNYLEHEVYIRERIGINGNIPELNISLEKMKNIVKCCYKTWDERVYKDLIKKFQIDEMVKIDKMSAGQQKLIEIIIELSKRPELLILDEPTVHLDPTARDEIMKILKAYVYDNEKTLIIVSHILSDMEQIADYLYFLDDGKIIEKGYKDDILEKKILVRGRKELLIDEVLNLCTNVKENEYNFEAITEEYDKVYEILGKEAIYEKPSFERVILDILERNKI